MERGSLSRGKGRGRARGSSTRGDSKGRGEINRRRGGKEGRGERKGKGNQGRGDSQGRSSNGRGGGRGKGREKESEREEGTETEMSPRVVENEDENEFGGQLFVLDTKGARKNEINKNDVDEKLDTNHDGATPVKNKDGTVYLKMFLDQEDSSVSKEDENEDNNENEMDGFEETKKEKKVKKKRKRGKKNERESFLVASEKIDEEKRKRREIEKIEDNKLKNRIQEVEEASRRTKKQISEFEHFLETAVFGSVDRNFGEEEEDNEFLHKKKKRKLEEDKKEVPKSAWIDEDDATLEIALNKKGFGRYLKEEDEENNFVVRGDEFSERLRVHHANFSKTVEWASNFQEETDELLRSTKTTVEKQFDLLPSGTIKVILMKNMNSKAHSKAAIRSLDYHSSGEVIAVAGADAQINIFEANSKEKARLQHTKFTDLPLLGARFTKDGSEIVAHGSRSYFYVVDVLSSVAKKVTTLTGKLHSMQRGKLTGLSLSNDNQYIAFATSNGCASILSRKTKQWITDFQIPGANNVCVDFSSDSNYVYTAGNGGTILTWDMRQRKCLRKYTDYGSLSTSAIRNSPRSLYQATGSISGVVNIYRTDDSFLKNSNPTPLKEMMNLTTPITNLTFNNDCQLLAMYSKTNTNALRLVHLPSCTAFSNFPPVPSLLGNVTEVAFSPDSSHMVVGNTAGTAMLYKLIHYSK